MDKIVKIFNINEKGINSTKLVPKDELENLRGKIVVINPEESEIAKKLSIKEKGVYGARFK